MEYTITTKISNDFIYIEAIHIETKIGYKTEHKLDNMLFNFNEFELTFTNLGNKLLINCKYQENEFDIFLDEIKITYGNYIELLNKINKLELELINLQNEQNNLNKI
jgi:hypothetical protein